MVFSLPINLRGNVNTIKTAVTPTSKTTHATVVTRNHAQPVATIPPGITHDNNNPSPHF
jgi:hypothetical protein